MAKIMSYLQYIFKYFKYSAITIALMLDDRGFYVIVLCSGHSDSSDEKIIILERANCICILYAFY
jgi:hypothetical protein